MPNFVTNIGNLAVCQKFALILMLYPVISLINQSPFLLPIDLKGYWELIEDVANSKRPLLIIPKVQLRLRVTRRSATALARYSQKCNFAWALPTEVGKMFLRVKNLVTGKCSCVYTVNNRGRLELATSAINLDGRINLHGKEENVFLIRIGVP